MDEFVDRVFICVYCGDLLSGMTDEQMERFGKPECCDFNMLPVDREKVHTIVRSLDTLRENLEEELLESIL